MARLYPRSPQDPPGKLVIEEYHPNCVEVFYIPPPHKLELSGRDPDDAEQYKTKILCICGQNDRISIFPINTWADHADFLKPKYDKIRSITLDGFDYDYGTLETVEEVIEILEYLPSGFVKDYDYGLGLQKDYRFIVDAVEEMDDIQHIVISKKAKTEILADAGICTINFKEYDEIRKKINTITNRAQSAARKIKSLATHNVLASFLNTLQYPQKTHLAKNDTLGNLISSDTSEQLSKSEQERVIKLFSKNMEAIAEDQPEELIKLRTNIEVGTLKRLIEKFKEMLGKKRSEAHWQKLFNDNPFILNLAFGYPIITIQDQAHVGGRKFSGAGEKITDFLVKHGISNNAALFEIKTPTTKLLNKRPYRENLYAPSSDLAGAINQMLDQIHKFQKEIATLKENARIHNLESYAVHGVLIIGKTPQDVDQQKSFELFRGNSKDIAIITFDELLEKLKLLHGFLSSNEQEGI